MIRQYSRCCKLEYKNKEVTSSVIWNMIGAANQEDGSIDRIAFLQKFNFGLIAHWPIKLLGF